MISAVFILSSKLLYAICMRLEYRRYQKKGQEQVGKILINMVF